MVRFARAKGSKASNERLPEDATSWSEMKQQMTESQKKVGKVERIDISIKEEKDATNTSWATFDLPSSGKPSKKRPRDDSDEVSKDDSMKGKRSMENNGNFEKKLKSRNKKVGPQSSKNRGPKVQTIYIKGRALETCTFDGFPVLKEDWERLTILRKKMEENNISKDEMKSQLKLHRRRAEKALQRAKKKVCLHCRQPGHFIAECPALNENNSTGDNLVAPAYCDICFKCGSTEHSYLKCKVAKDKSFRFATCFICKEQGHISRECSLNPRGIYPKGGACKVCGDVTHLKKDCPQYQQNQQESAITLPTLSSNQDLEAL